LYHHERQTRGPDASRAQQNFFTGELRHFTGKWWEALQRGDPFYSPNFSLAAADFSVRD
jgi:hypothetical protein